jgi:RNA polymerase II-associated factor 1
VSRNNLPPGHASAGVDLKCKIKYQNNLPDVPFDPKSIAYPFDPNRYIAYKPTNLEKQFKWDILNEQDLGIRIDLINQDYNKFNADCIKNLI